MKITKNTVVSLRYKLTDAKGKLLEESKQPMVYLHGGYDNVFPKIEAALEDRLPGYQTTVELAPADTVGPRDDSLVRTVPRANLPSSLKVGQQLRGGDGPDGHPMVFTVKEISKKEAVLDANHPLAGQDVRFALTVLEVREATEEEIAHCHVHGPHGHHH